MSEDLTKKLPKTDSEKISLILTTVQNLEPRVDNIDLRITKLETRFDALEHRFEGLEQKVEQRLYDTRPILQKVVADIAQLQEGQTRLEGEFKVSMREISFKLDVLNDTMLTVQARHKDLDIRVRELEKGSQKPTNSQT